MKTVLSDFPDDVSRRTVEFVLVGIAAKFGKLDLDSGRVRVDHKATPYWRTHFDRGHLDENFGENKERTKEIEDNVGPVLGDEEVA